MSCHVMSCDNTFINILPLQIYWLIYNNESRSYNIKLCSASNKVFIFYIRTSTTQNEEPQELNNITF